MNRRPRRQSQRVAAWIYTVVNPIVDSLHREMQLLENGNLTWRHYSQRCEYVRPLQEYVESGHWPNYEDFLADNGRFREHFAEHDEAVQHLEAQASNAYDILVQAPIFQKQVSDCLQAYETKADASHPLQTSLAHMKQELPKYVAEYLVNNIESLPAHYSAQKFWEMFAHEFQSFRQRQSFVSLSTGVQDLLHISNKLRRTLEDHRLFLCRKFDVPAAPISLTVNVGDAF